MTDNHPPASLIPKGQKDTIKFLKKKYTGFSAGSLKVILSKTANSSSSYLDKTTFARRRQTAEVIRSRGGDREAENSSKFLLGRSIALRRPGRAVAISMTPQLAGRRSAALWEAPLPCHLPPAALGLGSGSPGPARSSPWPG